MKHDSTTLSLDRDALSQALAENLEEYGLESVEEYNLDAFSENACRAIVELIYKALDEWACLRQTDGADWQVVVYALDSEYENNILVAVRRDRGALVQLATLTIDANRLVEGEYERKGADLVAELVEAVLEEANRLLSDAPALTTAPACAGYMDEQVSVAYNKAADEVLEAIDAPDEGVRDAINLIVNAGAFFLKQPDAHLPEAIKDAYQEDAQTVLDWARAGLS
jgi:DNA-binding transcriptional ArsR family regulator